MELSGELIAGRFFAGIDSLQFTSPAILKEFEKAESFKGLYWLNAADPASIAGLALAGTDANLCARNTGSRLYYRGDTLIAVSSRSGKELRIFIGSADKDIAPLVSLIKLPRTRKIMPEAKVLIEKINGCNAAQSEYAAAFSAAGFVSDRGKLFFW
jgi:ATP-dependent Lhr-like helicase